MGKKRRDYLLSLPEPKKTCSDCGREVVTFPDLVEWIANHYKCEACFDSHFDREMDRISRFLWSQQFPHIPFPAS